MTNRDPQPTSDTTPAGGKTTTPIQTDFSLAQQRFWTEWADAGRLWMSWWMNSLPSIGWPPVGTVLPPAPGAPLRTEAPGKQAGDLSAHQPPDTPPKHARASGTRHH